MSTKQGGEQNSFHTSDNGTSDSPNPLKAAKPLIFQGGSHLQGLGIYRFYAAQLPPVAAAGAAGVPSFDCLRQPAASAADHSVRLG